MTARRSYRRNLLAMGHERAAKFVLTAIRYSPNGGRKSVYVASDGGISVYPANNPGCAGKPRIHLVGTWGARVTEPELCAALERRYRQIRRPATIDNIAW